MTSATDELRRLLDEHGVEWRRTPHYSSESIDNETVFRGEGIEWIANDHLNGHIGLRALRYEVTPEQAVEATLGDADATGERQRDAVEVVRCRDCERFAVDQSDHDYRTGWWCKRWYTDMVKPDGFCAWGEKREDTDA